MNLKNNPYAYRLYDSATDAATINAAGQVATAAINYGNASSMTSRAKKYNMMMYDKARADAISDRDWQANYNSPREAMKRLQEAGLNPNLIYGNGQTASGQADQPRGVSPQHLDQTQPHIQFDGGSVMASYQNAKTNEAQVNNMKQQFELGELQKMYLAAQTGKVISDTDMTKFNLQQKEQLNQIYQESMALGVQKQAQDLDLSRQGNDRAIQMQAEQILSMQAQRSKVPAEQAQIQANIKKMQNDTELQRATLEWQKSADSKAPFWWRKIEQILSGYGITNQQSDNILQDLKKAKSATSSGGFLKSLGGSIRRFGGSGQ
ncbi:DNA pilot protein [Blackfly microvirus SF02]|uniref:DNA pilot protein n=1 Tax=Blackfly microvirus SF02 TaxID=2576452 RepID=A0A4P8PKI8_9VIRU|nr:DNA pilot protein [Blackfly microvirus SF02]